MAIGVSPLFDAIETIVGQCCFAFNPQELSNRSWTCCRLLNYHNLVATHSWFSFMDEAHTFNSWDLSGPVQGPGQLKLTPDKPYWDAATKVSSGLMVSSTPQSLSNFTRFFIVAKSESWPASCAASQCCIAFASLSAGCQPRSNPQEMGQIA